MTLQELERFQLITIQCHDNPDADALASGYGLYCYFKEQGKTSGWFTAAEIKFRSLIWC